MYVAGAVALRTAGAVAFTIVLKKALIRATDTARVAKPVWGSYYVRNWMVQRAAQLVPWRVMEGTVFLHVVLRAAWVPGSALRSTSTAG